jgi:superfamily II DNA or RNA helicase
MDTLKTNFEKSNYSKSFIYNLCSNRHYIRTDFIEKDKKTNAEETNWFKFRGLRVLNYQTDVINKVKDSLSKQEVTVLAACPSAGKTISAIYIIEDYLKQNPTHKVLVLAHGTTVLRTQFHDNFEDVYSKIKSDFDYKLVESFSEYDSNASINVCLPQTLNGKELDDIELLVVDEAHQFYFARMVKDIIKKTKPQKQLLLTGTPSIFIGNKYPIIPITLSTVFDEGMVSDLNVEIACSSYNFSMEDYYRGEVKADTNFKDSETKKTLDDLIGKIVERLKYIPGNDIPIVSEWLPALERLHKTMFVCKSQEQARQVAWYFNNLNVKSALSISDSDKDSSNIENFKTDEKCLILIVVGRGILGFNYPELVNVVDMTTSQNIDRIYQLMCRVIRKHPEGKKKLFFKIAPTELGEYYKYLMTAVLALTDESFYTKFDGKNSDELKIPVEKCPRLDTGGIYSKKNHPNFKPIEFKNLPALELFKYIKQNEDSLLNIYALTSMRDVRSEFLKITFWTKDKCSESALKYPSRSEWEKNEKNAYTAAHRKGWLNDCCIHMISKRKPHSYWTKERCVESASNYSTKKDWNKNERIAYDTALRKGWLEDCCKHMISINKHWTIEKCIESARKYMTIREWIKNENSSYRSAYRHGWLEMCCKHMLVVNKKIPGYWNIKANCLEDALKYQTIKEWRRVNISSYGAACRNKWVADCSKHMISKKKPKGYWDNKENCKRTALKFSSKKEWYKNDINSYNIVSQKGWLEECTIHMKPNNSTS